MDRPLPIGRDEPLPESHRRWFSKGIWWGGRNGDGTIAPIGGSCSSEETQKARGKQAVAVLPGVEECDKARPVGGELLPVSAEKPHILEKVVEPGGGASCKMPADSGLDLIARNLRKSSLPHDPLAAAKFLHAAGLWVAAAATARQHLVSHFRNRLREAQGTPVAPRLRLYIVLSKLMKRGLASDEERREADFLYEQLSKSVHELRMEKFRKGLLEAVEQLTAAQTPITPVEK